MSENPQVIRQQVEHRFKIAEEGDYYGLLGVSKTSTIEEIRKSYFAVAKNLHPDKVGRLGLEDIKPKATKLFKLATEAYNVLTDPQKRKEYDSGALKASTPSVSGAAAVVNENNAEGAKIAFYKGRVMMQKRSYEEAEEHFRTATDLNNEVARYWQSLGWAIFNNESVRKEEERLEASKEAYEKALEIDGDDALTHYNIGLYWKARGETRRMKRALEKAVQNDKNNIDAKRELRLLKMREKKGKKNEPSPGGFWASLWHELTKKR